MRYLVSASIGFMLGFFGMQYAFNIGVLEDNALLLSKMSYISGCKNEKGNNCLIKAEAFRNEIGGIFKDMVWSR